MPPGVRTSPSCTLLKRASEYSSASFARAIIPFQTGGAIQLRTIFPSSLTMNQGILPRGASPTGVSTPIPCFAYSG
jgi:hypothetical protein